MKNYPAEFKAQIIKEIEEVGNLSLVCRKHELKFGTVHGWLKREKNRDKIQEAKLNRDLQKKIKDQEHEILVKAA